QLYPQYSHTEDHTHLIDLAVRLWLMVNIRSDGSDMMRDVSLWPWENDCSLRGFVDTVVESISLSGPLGTPESFIDAQFNARNMEQKTRFKVNLTSNLMDHLNYDWEERRVDIFYSASFLTNALGAINSG